MPRTTVLVALVLAVLVLAGCGVTMDSTEAAAEKQRAEMTPKVTEGLKQEGVLTVGVRVAATPPYAIDMDGDLSGLDVDVACSLAESMGLQTSFVYVSNVKDALQDTCDIVMSVNADGASGYDVVGHYVDSAIGLFHEGEATVVSVDDLDGATLSLQDGSAAQMALRLTSLEVSESPTETLGEAFDTLEEEDADFVLCNVVSGAYLALRYDDITFAGSLSAPAGAGIAVSSGEGQLQSALREAYQEIESNGILAETRRCWLGDLPLLDASSQVADVPLRETEGDSLEDLSVDAEVLEVALDGSTAGANAVSLKDVSSTTSTQTTQTSPYANYWQDDDDYVPTTYQNYQTYDYEDYGTQTTTTNDYDSADTDTYADTGDYDNAGDYGEQSYDEGYSAYEGGDTIYGEVGDYAESLDE